MEEIKSKVEDELNDSDHENPEDPQYLFELIEQKLTTFLNEIKIKTNEG